MSEPVRETSTDYASPFRPRPVAVLNRIGARMRQLGVRPKPLTAEALMRAARRATGLSDFGDGSFREPLRVLLDSVEREAQLTTTGQLITRGRIQGILENRLRAEATIARYPEIEHVDVRAPIVIAGLQRTGTTMLHRLLAEDLDLRALASWEALNPAPVPRRPWHRGEPRQRTAQLSERGLAYLAPDFFAIHPVEADAPEEEVILLDYSFMSTVAESTLHVPTYARWLEQQDQLPAYRYLRRLLQLLMWQHPGERWLLKTPHHLEWLDTLFEVFPDATVVWTHRTPHETIPSFCSMIAHGRGVFSDAVDPREIGDHWSRKNARLVSRALATRDRLGDARFVDVRYEDLMRDPIAEVERIYEVAGRELSRRTRISMEASRRRNRKDRHGRHVYRKEDFGLTDARIDELFADYIARFSAK